MSAWAHLSEVDALARARCLDQLSGPGGIVAGAAADHRDALRAALDRQGIALDGDAIGRLKADIAAVLGTEASALLLDGSGARHAIAAGALPGSCALVLPLERSGYGDVASVELTEVDHAWPPAGARRLGATACKLLLPFRADRPDQAAGQEDVARACAEACRAAGCVLVLEPIVYRRPGEDLSAARYAALVIEGAARLAAADPGLLKLQHPGDAAACRELDAAVGPATPWVVLGGGAPEDVVAAQVEQACAAGASGFIVGRTLWADALGVPPARRLAVLAATALPRLRRLAEIARLSGQPWRARVGPLHPLAPAAERRP